MNVMEDKNFTKLSQAELSQNVESIYDAVVGDEFRNGFKQRIERLEKMVERLEKIISKAIWVITGGAMVLSAIISLVMRLLV